MGEEAVEMGFGSEVQDLCVMRVVYVSEDAEKLSVEMLHCRWERGREVLVCESKLSCACS